MKKTIYLAITMLSITVASCRDKENVEKTDGSDHTTIENEKSSVTETGQRIGNTKDSTSVVGEPGNPSND